MGHLMMENRNGLIVDARLTEANGTAERTTALDMIDDNAKPGSTVGGDKNYDTADFVAVVVNAAARHMSHRTTPTAARRSMGATTRHPGYAVSMTKRKRIEEPFGWMKTVGGLRKTRHCGRELVERLFVWTAAAEHPSAFHKFWQRQDESAWNYWKCPPDRANIRSAPTSRSPRTYQHKGPLQPPEILISSDHFQQTC